MPLPLSSTSHNTFAYNNCCHPVCCRCWSRSLYLYFQTSVFVSLSVCFLFCHFSLQFATFSLSVHLRRVKFDIWVTQPLRNCLININIIINGIGTETHHHQRLINTLTEPTLGNEQLHTHMDLVNDNDNIQISLFFFL